MKGNYAQSLESDTSQGGVGTNKTLVYIVVEAILQTPKQAEGVIALLAPMQPRS
jgi:hypothetical protein